MRFKHTFYCFLWAVLTATLQAQTPASLTTLGAAYTQNFDTLANTGTSSLVPAGWAFLETGTNAETTYNTGTGSNNAGNTYSFGATASTERAFGGLLSGSLVPTIGAAFTNNTGSTISSLAISYVGEQWRMGTLGRADRLVFAYSTDATALNDGTWTAVTNLDFNAPTTTGTVGALDGNAAANRTTVTFTISGLSIANGATFRIRWTDFNATNADDGLAVDDFSLTPQGSGPVIPSLSINDVSQAEGNAGTTNFAFTVSLNAPAGVGGVTFDIATADNTATVAETDYVAQSLTAQTIPEGSSTYTFTVAVNGDSVPESNETFFVNVTNATGATVSDGQATGTILNEDVPLVSINQIQGSGNTSPLSGTVSTTGIVTARVSNGFFLQNPDANGDGNPATSEGIFVFTSAAPPAAAAVGNSVLVTGTVTEFIPSADPSSPPTTELTSPTVLLLSSGNSLPTPVTITTSLLTPTGGFSQLERFEGMRVTVASLTAVAPTDGNVSEPNATSTSTGVFYGVLTGTALPFREAGIEAFAPAPLCAAGSGCQIPVFDANPERLRVDSDAAGQSTLNVTTGNTIANLTGVLHYGFRAYTILPTETASAGGTPVQLTSTPIPGAGSLTIAAMNVERLYDTVADAGVDDVVVTATAFSNRLGKISQTIRNVLHTPDVVTFEEAENLNVLQSLASRISQDAVAASQPDPGYIAFLVEGQDIGGIDVGFLVSPATVTIQDVVQLGGAGTTFTNPCDGGQDLMNDRPPLRLRATATKSGQNISFVLFANHLRSLNGIDDTGACGTTTAGHRVRVKRAAQADYLAGLIQSELTANPSAKVIAVGDFNAFEVNDGYVDSLNAIIGSPAPATRVVTATSDPAYPNLTNLLNLLPAPQRYSYVFDGNHQTLDHVLMTPSAAAVVSGGGYGRVNADFPETLRNDPNSPQRYSDHDPVVVHLTTATNVTANTTVTRAGLVYNRVALTASSYVTVKNNTLNAITGPLQVVITGLPAGVTISNASSNNGAAYVFNLPATLNPGQSVNVPISFALTSLLPINYTAAVFSGVL
jgi:uncharacterized protein